MRFAICTAAAFVRSLVPASVSRFWTCVAGFSLAILMLGGVTFSALSSFDAYRSFNEAAVGDGTGIATQIAEEHRKLLHLLDQHRLGDARDQLDVFWARLAAGLEVFESRELLQWSDLAASLKEANGEMPGIAAALARIDRSDDTGFEAVRQSLKELTEPVARLLDYTVTASRKEMKARLDAFYWQFKLLLGTTFAAVAVLVILLLLERRHSERRAMLLQTTLDTMDQGLTVYDKDLRLVTVNRRLRDMMPLPADVVAPGAAFEALIRHHVSQGDYPELIDGDIDAFVRARVEIAMERIPVRFTITRTDGTVIEIRRNPMPDRGFVTTYTDVTVSKQAERELANAKAAAEAANKAKSEFLANMSHELRTPLNAIIGFSEMMSHAMLGPMPAPYQEYAGIIHQSGNHLLSLINDILDLAKIEAGRLELHEEPVSIESVVDFSITAVEGLRQKSDVTIEKHVDPLVPHVLADERMCKQICVNLLSNAVKFTPAGGRVEARIDLDDGRLRLRIIDTGIGIDKEHLAKVFDPFYQVEGSYARQHAGTGLGLPLTRELVAMHGGIVSVESELSVGTTVTVIFPRRRQLGPAGSAKKIAL